MTGPLLLMGFGAALLILAGLAIRERRKAKHPPELLMVNWQYREYLGAGRWRDYYALLEGRELDSHEACHLQEAQAARLEEIREQNKSGRLLGRYSK